MPTDPFAEKVAIFKEIFKPQMIDLVKNFLYIVEKDNISIYQQPDMKFIRKFGKEGEGPQEFKLNGPAGKIKPVFMKDKIFVMSFNKISYFSPEGYFVSEKIISPNFTTVRPFKNSFITYGIFPSENKVMEEAIYVFDKNFQNKKKVCSRSPIDFNIIKIFPKTIDYTISNDMLFVSTHDHFKIEVFNEFGDKINSIEKKYQQRLFTTSDKEIIINNFKKKNIWESLKSSIEFPEYFPAIKYIIGDCNNLYVFTNKERQGKTELIVLDQSGFEIKHIYLTVEKEEQTYFPFIIRDNIFYQLRENINEETFELHKETIE
jgi:hypothetical protein